jgi:uncharacterized protein (TIGR02266 family)
MADTRKDKRAPVSLKVRFKSATVDEFIEHYSKDVSRGGIFIKSSQPMVVGTLLKFQFQLKDESALIRGVGRVVWTRAEEDAGADQPAGMGIKFIKMDTESRAMVERIVDYTEPESGTYERGRATASTAEATSSAPPPPAPSGGNFFPVQPPAELPPPEDRTAVRQATQLLAMVMKEGATDQAAAREAQEKGEEARRRTEELEAARRAEAEAPKRKETPKVELPSMIIDPSLDHRERRSSEPSVAEMTPMPPLNKPAFTAADADKEPDTEPPPAPVVVGSKSATTSFPHTPQAARKNYLPVAVIAALLVVAAIVALRGGPRELAVDESTSERPPVASAPIIQPAPAPEPTPQPVEQVREPEPIVDAGASAAAAEPAEPLALVFVEVATTPKGAEVSVGDVVRGVGPVTLELEKGVPVVIRARAPGFAESQQELTPDAKKNSVRLKLKPLRYIVHVESTPAGASVNVGGVKGTTPVDLQLDKPPTQELSVNARLDGYESARMRLAPIAFTESEGAMRAMLNLTLKASLPESSAKEGVPPATSERPKKAPPTHAKPAELSPTGVPSPVHPASPKAEAPNDAPAKPEATPQPPPDKLAPPPSPAETSGTAVPKADAPAKTPKEQLPDNPFGD